MWEMGDQLLGGGAGEEVQLTAEGGWRYEESVLAPNSDSDEDGRRLVWRFDLEGGAVDFTVLFIPGENGREVC